MSRIIRALNVLFSNHDPVERTVQRMKQDRDYIIDLLNDLNEVADRDKQIKEKSRQIITKL